MDFSVIGLYLYAILLFILFLHSLVKRRPFLIKAMWGLYASIGLTCVVSYELDITTIGGLVDYTSFKTMTWPYLLLIVCYYISFIPFKYIDKKTFTSTSKIEIPSGSIGPRLSVIFSLIYIILFAVYFILSLPVLRELIALGDWSYIRESYYDQQLANSNNGFIYIVSSAFCHIFVLFAFYISINFRFLKKNKFLALLLLVSALGFVVCDSMKTSSRGNIFMYFSVCFFIFFYLKKKHHTKINRTFLFFLIVALFAVTFYVIDVTVSRFNEQGGVGNSIIYYFGSAPVFFNVIASNIKKFQYGAFTYGYLLSKFGFEDPYPYLSGLYDPAIGPVFTTHLGPVYVDFGVIGCLLITIFASLIMTYLIKRKLNKLSTLYLMCYYIFYLVNGAFCIGRIQVFETFKTLVIYTVLLIFENVTIKRASNPRFNSSMERAKISDNM